MIPVSGEAAWLPTAIRLADRVRLRRENFGGLAFDLSTGNTIDLDREAFRLLELAGSGVLLAEAHEVVEQERPKSRRRGANVATVLPSLLDLGFAEAEESDAVFATPEVILPAGGPWPGPPLTAPEAVHWAITYRCHSACADCYAARHRSAQAIELPTAEALRLVDRVAEWGPFQLAIGGGEPLLREDLPLLASHAREAGLAVNVTTSGVAPGGVSDGVIESLDCLEIGIRHDDLLGSGRAAQNLVLPELCRRAEAHGVSIGANLVLCRKVVGHFEMAVKRLVKAGFRRITLQRYQPPGSAERWLEEVPKPADLEGMETRIARQIEIHPGLALRLDCGLAFLQRHLSTEEAWRTGLRGCRAGARIVALGPDGSVYPCSQLVAPRLRAGNLLQEDPALIWRESRVLRRYGNLRAKRSFRQTLCGACQAVERCGGCRALSTSGLDADRGCPEPLLPPLNVLGREGRVADLGRYLEGAIGISVGEYMDRYSVGQKRAVSELRRHPDLVLADRSGGGKRKVDRYELLDPDPVGDIQDMIGRTNWGFPYATREEIEGWIGLDETGVNYPDWLIELEPSSAAEHDEPTGPELIWPAEYDEPTGPDPGKGDDEEDWYADW